MSMLPFALSYPALNPGYFLLDTFVLFTFVCYTRRAESEMDIVLQNPSQSPTKSATAPKTPLKAPTPNPLKVTYSTFL